MALSRKLPKDLDLSSSDYRAIPLRNAWIFFSHKSAAKCTEFGKFHISIKHDRKTIQQAVGLLLPIFSRYKFSSFKCADWEVLCSDMNTDGKGFVCYIKGVNLEATMSKASINSLADMLQEIEVILEKNGIEPHPAGSLGDAQLVGTRYIYSRSANNIIDRYIPAEFLFNGGFTCEESVNISPNLVILAIQQELLRRHFVLPLETISLPVIHESKAALSSVSYVNNWKELRATSSLEVDARRIYDEYILEQLPWVARVCLGGKEAEYSEAEEKLFYLLYPLLREAARRVAMIHHLMDESDLVPSFSSKDTLPSKLLGVVAPAIYYKFFKPWMEKFQSKGFRYDNANNIEYDEAVLGNSPDPERYPTLNPQSLFEEYLNPEDIINAIVKNSLRSPAPQIKNLAPLYIYNLSEAKIDKLIELQARIRKNSLITPVVNIKEFLRDATPLSLVPKCSYSSPYFKLAPVFFRSPVVSIIRSSAPAVLRLKP